jgi:uncharacterized membrane protein (UPF0127 family)
MPWLLRDGAVLAALEVASARSDRRRGLLGRGEFEGALIIEPARAVHTIGMRFAIDVAYCARKAEGELLVLDTRTMPRYRVGRPRIAARCVIEAQSGAFERWGLAVGHVLMVA